MGCATAGDPSARFAQSPRDSDVDGIVFIITLARGSVSKVDSLLTSGLASFALQDIDGGMQVRTVLIETELLNAPTTNQNAAAPARVAH